MTSSPSLLLVAISARVLAQSAARAGIPARALDLFADEDTQAAVARCEAVPAQGQGFDEGALLAAAGAYPGGELVYGGGIDTRPGLLEALSRGRALLGNSPATLREVKTPERFFQRLRELAIPFPDVRFSSACPPGSWLFKQGGGEGGWCVRACQPGEDRVAPDGYFQQRLTGRAHSVLFIANGREALTIGFNTLFTSARDASRPYRFAGAVNRADLSQRQREAVAGQVDRLTRALGLVGLNGLDFMLEGGEARVLELNPRPTATLQLHDPDLPGGWLRPHMAACRGALPSSVPVPGPLRGFRVVFAEHALEVPEGIQWPPWCADRPGAQVRIEPGTPLCTVLASGADPDAVERQLNERDFAIQALMEKARPEA